MNETTFAVVAGIVAGALLVLLCVRTVLTETRAGRGGAEARGVRRPTPVLMLDFVAVALVVILLTALLGRMIVALSG
ncbi:MAG TPA: hypothetical protein VHW44_24100 [Pseudonocardiaceae bacterium]|nr:hypothetical protein [Pseudonocardiaceae bacterium]